MPLSKTGESVLKSMQDQYGEKKGKEVFYASINKGKKGSDTWEKSSKKKKNEKHKSYPAKTLYQAKGGDK